MKFKKVKVKRRREGKTDYKARALFLKSKFPRLVIRKTNRYIIMQIISSKEAKDFTNFGITSKILSSFGWKSSFKNIPAAYATGLVFGKKAIEKGIKKAILDSGIIRSTKGSKIYAAVKGAKDSGLAIECNEKIYPSESRVLGEDTKDKDSVKEIINKLKQGK